MKASLLFVISFILLNIWSGCRTTQYVPVMMESVKVEYQDKYVRDSIYVRDSVEVKINGDTVWVYKDRYVLLTGKYVTVYLSLIQFLFLIRMRL